MTDSPTGAVVSADVFARRYLTNSRARSRDRDDADLRSIADEARRFGAVRPWGETLLHVHDVEPGGAEARTVVDIVSGDGSFILESIFSELARSGYAVETSLHPQLVMTRDAEGRMTRVHDVDDTGDIPDGAIVESWVHLELVPVPPDEQPGLRRRLERVLDDVLLAAADAPHMLHLVRKLAEDLQADPGPFDRETSAEAGRLLRWLADGNFLIVGHESYTANELAGVKPAGSPRDADGVLSGSARVSPRELLPAYRSGAPLTIFKSPLVSTVRQPVHYDCVTVLTPGTDGAQELHVFLGLISNVEDGSVARVPVLRRRIAEVMRRSGVRPASHTGRRLLAALRTLPRDELLEVATSDLLRLAQLVVDRADRGTVGVFARVHLNRDFVSVLIYFSAERFGPAARHRVAEIVAHFWPGDVIGHDDRLVELGLARMQFLIALPPGRPVPSPDLSRVERELAAATRTWLDDIDDEILRQVPQAGQRQELRRLAAATPEAYREDVVAADALGDLRALAALPARDGLDFRLSVAPDDEPAAYRLRVLRTGQAVSLAQALPLFTRMGIEVLDERPYEVDGPHGCAWIYDFGLRLPRGAHLDDDGATRVVATLRRLWRGHLEQDGFNALVVVTGLTWWQANILRVYAKYLRQAATVGTTFSQGYVEDALIENPGIAAGIVALFESRFDPAREGETPLVSGRSRLEVIEDELAEVRSLDQDRILRSLLGLVNATVRTNAYRVDDHGDRRSATALKLDPRRIDGLPEPLPRHEIWVHSSDVEGVHLRFGPVARGGLRWSDRREDFRTEILGLVKAQVVKNAVIVPTGAKGGFVVKTGADPTDRDAWLAAGTACYRTFIACLLDLTDNYVTAADGTQTVVPPERTRRYDTDDPYLVVAADKGTATFSDIANGIAIDYGFWLGDAFASGGSVGYDHKAMGITARGAWESVKYHFRELDLDTQTQDVTVVGIGDMSGDVFGNGMLLSPHIRLVAAFDHRHVFLDPDPDAAASFVERQRMFALPRSSWADYDTALISPGGGVYPRTAKAVPISPQVAQALGLPGGVASLPPTELIRAVLRAPVDLLWNGGIGTYVKATAETNASVGDKTNDAVRVDALELRCRVVGEGGNLGLTQLGRIEFARAGGHINTDAIDNSAGVDTSDHEVNLKILLDRAVAAGSIDRDERNALLAASTDDVAAHVLRDNYEQNVLLGMARMLDVRLASVHERFMTRLAEAGELDRALEFLPSDAEMARRIASGQGLCSPENAVLLAYSKTTLTAHIEDSTVPDEPWFAQVLASYFPPAIADRFAEELVRHPLHREIVTTVLVNDMINRSGTTFAFRAVEETGVDVPQVARAYSVVREVFRLPALWAEIEALDNQVPTSAQHAAYFEIRRLVDRATRWLLDVRFPITDVGIEVTRFAGVIADLGPRTPELLRGVELQTLYDDAESLVKLGLPKSLSLRVAELLSAFLLLDVVEIADATGRAPATVAAVHYALSERLGIDQLLTRVTALPRDDRWSALARFAVRHDVYETLSAVTTAVLTTTPDVAAATPSAPDQAAAADHRIDEWVAEHRARVDRARTTVGAALDRDDVDLATVSVALRMLRSLAG